MCWAEGYREGFVHCVGMHPYGTLTSSRKKAGRKESKKEGRQAGRQAGGEDETSSKRLQSKDLKAAKSAASFLG